MPSRKRYKSSGRFKRKKSSDVDNSNSSSDGEEPHSNRNTGIKRIRTAKKSNARANIDEASKVGIVLELELGFMFQI